MGMSNWKGSSAWGAIDDPTTVLSGRVLVASAGATQTTEDYLTQIVGTSTAFNIAHYCVKMDYAFVTGSYEFDAGTLGLIARAGNYSAATPSTAQDGYIASFSNRSSTVDIVRRLNGVENTLASAVIPPNISTVSTRHTLQFKCYGTSPTNLRLYIDDKIAINIGDNTTSELTTGDPGIQVIGGTVYADDFTIIEYTSTGTEPAAWTPASLATPANMSVWLRSDSGVTEVAGIVTAWTDKSTNSNNATGGGTGPGVASGSINGYDTVIFSGSAYMSIADAATLDLNSSGVSFIALVKTTSSASGTQGIIAKDATWNYSLKMSASGQGSASFDDGTSSDESTVGGVPVNNWNIVIMNKSDKYYVNGSAAGTAAYTPGANNAYGVVIGAWYNNVTPAFSKYLTGEIAEVIAYAGQLTEAERQKIEGYIAHRYGLSSNLPSTHPYRNFAPTV